MSDVLNKKVLALNSAWFPIDVISVRDAFRLASKDNARFMETINETYVLYTLDAWFDIYVHESYSKISTVSLEIPVPEIIVLTDYDSIPKKTIKFTKENLLIRDGYKCSYCSCDLTLDTTTIDHVVPASKGGKTTWENCTSACKACNHAKADNPPHGIFKPKKQPREPNSVSPIYKINKKKGVGSVPQSWHKFLFR